jgi:hypothetical protein
MQAILWPKLLTGHWPFLHSVSLLRLYQLVSNNELTESRTDRGAAIVTYKLWKNSQRSRQGTRDGYRVELGDNLFSQVILIFVESAALYTINNLLYLILFATHSVIEAIFSTLVRVSTLYHASVSTFIFVGCTNREYNFQRHRLPHSSSSSLNTTRPAGSSNRQIRASDNSFG